MSGLFETQYLSECFATRDLPNCRSIDRSELIYFHRSSAAPSAFNCLASTCRYCQTVAVNQHIFGRESVSQTGLVKVIENCLESEACDWIDLNLSIGRFIILLFASEKLVGGYLSSRRPPKLKRYSGSGSVFGNHTQHQQLVDWPVCDSRIDVEAAITCQSDEWRVPRV